MSSYEFIWRLIVLLLLSNDNNENEPNDQYKYSQRVAWSATLFYKKRDMWSTYLECTIVSSYDYRLSYLYYSLFFIICQSKQVIL